MSTNSRQLKAASKSQALFEAQVTELSKLQKKVGQAFLAYKRGLDACTAQTSETELLMDSLMGTPEGKSAAFEATKLMQETQMSFNLQYLQLQSQMQHENRSYTVVSNIMKTKHDTVKNSISNVR